MIEYAWMDYYTIQGFEEELNTNYAGDGWYKKPDQCMFVVDHGYRVQVYMFDQPYEKTREALDAMAKAVVRAGGGA